MTPDGRYRADSSSPTATLTFSGKVLDFAKPVPEAIDIVDIATGLAGEIRFNSQIIRPYSVAEHSVLVAMRVEEVGRPELALSALLHDAHEAYTRDIIKPLKRLFGDIYDERAVRPLNVAIAAAFRVSPESFSHPVVKTADRWLYEIERAHLQRGDEADEAGVRILYEGRYAWPAPWPIGLDKDAAEALFHMHYRRLWNQAVAAGWLLPSGA